jgi:hypothetical protein
MVIAVKADQKRGAAPGYYVRPDLIGKVAMFDGDHFMIDFARPDAGARAS